MKKAKVSSAAQTVIIWDEVSAELVFFVLDGDYTKFNGVYINQVDVDEKLLDELNELMYVQETGEHKHEKLSAFPVDAVRNGAVVIVAGFLP
jgi:hypothetical protein